jgi:hypothetical protein
MTAAAGARAAAARATLPGGDEPREMRERPESRELDRRDDLAGIDRATALLYDSVLDSPIHGPFIRRIAEISRRPAPAAWTSDALLAIVPAAFYRENPGSGADGRLLRDEADRLGCPVEVVPIASTGSVRQNAAIIRGWLAERVGRRILLASLSKGGADVKMALAEAGAESLFGNVAAWLNLCGTLGGTPLAAWLLSREGSALLTRFYYRLRGQSLGFIGDLRYRCGGPLDGELRLPAHLTLVNVVGFPLREHFEHAFSRRCHRRLAPLGPNDGSLVLADVCALPGLLYPVWGADHYLQPKTDVRRLIGAILQYLDETLAPRRLDETLPPRRLDETPTRQARSG